MPKNEQRAIALLAEILGVDSEKVKRQYTFDWLCGDKGTKLPVDAYFENYGLVFEYRGPQHYKPNRLMDRRPGRAEQRKHYDKLRDELIPAHGLKLLILRYDAPLTREYLTQGLRELGLSVLQVGR